MSNLEDKQRRYYAENAKKYEETHVRENDEHSLALRYMMAVMRVHGVERVLDIGCGTGRAVRVLHENGFDVVGIEPVQDLIDEGHRNGTPQGLMMRGEGEHLPFADKSFDAVCEFGVLHHVKKPQKIVREMLRVSRTGVFLSDTNRFARGNVPSRLSKFLLWKSRLWSTAYYLNTRGKNCDISECDGIAYSYSVYDQYHLIDSWADRVIMVPTKVEGKRSRTWFHPLFTSSHVLLCGIKDSRALNTGSKR